MELVPRRSFLVPITYSILESRLKNYSFSYAFDYTSVDFTMTVPSLNPSWMSLFHPFSGHVWLATCVTCALLPVVMKWVGRLLLLLFYYYFFIGSLVGS